MNFYIFRGLFFKVGIIYHTDFLHGLVFYSNRYSFILFEYLGIIGVGKIIYSGG